MNATVWDPFQASSRADIQWGGRVNRADAVRGMTIATVILAMLAAIRFAVVRPITAALRRPIG